MRDRLILVFLALVVAGCFGHLVYPSGPFSGRVVDATTGQPLAGAAVVAVWRQEGPGPGHPTERLHDALEVVADAGGYFTLPRRIHVTTVGSITDPYIVVYSPGYREGLLEGRDFRESDTNGAPLTVALTRPATSDRRRFAHIPSVASGVSLSKMPTLLRLVNIERRALGLDTYEDK